MAINNMYKPSWRSRRRSRLSLVERSVPKLGHNPPADDQTHQLTFDSSEDSDIARDSVNEAVDQQSPDEQQISLPPSVDDQEVHQVEEALPLLAKPSHSTADRGETIEPAHVENVENVETLTQLQSHLPIDTTHSESLDSEIELQPGTPVQENSNEDGPLVEAASAISLHSEASDDEDDQTQSAEQSLVLPKALADSWDIEGVSEAAKTKVVFDWSSLLTSGIVDPRNRRRPLPANVDDITRALIRQALSDQSSWRDRVILVSSARETRAKSMAAINFAFALTTIDHHSVVLLDANMDGSGVGPYLGAASMPGLTTALCDSTLDIEDIALKTSLDRLTVVSSGAFEDDILDRFASRRMLEILRFLTKDPTTLLVLDAPPILSSQEATVLSVIAGQVVLVVEAGTTNKHSLNHALKRIGDRHNISLVLSRYSGVERDEPKLVETPASRRLALPKPKDPPMKRYLKRAAASFAILAGIGLSMLLGTTPMLSGRTTEEGLLKAWTVDRVPVLNSETDDPVAGVTQ